MMWQDDTLLFGLFGLALLAFYACLCLRGTPTPTYKIKNKNRIK